MKKRSFWFVMLVAVIGVSLSACGSSMMAQKPETVTPPPPIAKVVPPEAKIEVPVTPPPPEIKKEVPPLSAPAPAPKKKKKG